MVAWGPPSPCTDRRTYIHTTENITFPHYVAGGNNVKDLAVYKNIFKAQIMFYIEEVPVMFDFSSIALIIRSPSPLGLISFIFMQFSEKIGQTRKRMHSSRMRTARLLPVSPRCTVLEGVYLPRGVYLPWGVYLLKGDVPAGVGGTCPRGGTCPGTPPVDRQTSVKT